MHALGEPVLGNSVADVKLVKSRNREFLENRLEQAFPEEEGTGLGFRTRISGHSPLQCPRGGLVLVR